MYHVPLPPRKHPDYGKLYQQMRRHNLPKDQRTAEQNADQVFSRERRAFIGNALKAGTALLFPGPASTYTDLPGPASLHSDDRLEYALQEVRALQGMFSHGYGQAKEVAQRARALQGKLQNWQLQGRAAQRLWTWTAELILDAGLPGEPSDFLATLEPSAAGIANFWLACGERLHYAKACLIYANLHATAYDRAYCHDVDPPTTSLKLAIKLAQTAYTLLLDASLHRRAHPAAAPLLVESVAQLVRFRGFYGEAPVALTPQIQTVEHCLSAADWPAQVQIHRELSFYYRLPGGSQDLAQAERHLYAAQEAAQHLPLPSSRLRLLRPQINLQLEMNNHTAVQTLIEEYVELVRQEGGGAHHQHQLQLWARAGLSSPWREVPVPTRYTSPYISDLYRPATLATL